MSRIRITREEFVNCLIEVKEPPKVLKTKLDKPPFCHLLSTYVIRPVAGDEQPFVINHKNKQPLYVQNKKHKGHYGPRPSDPQATIQRNEVDTANQANDEDSDDFEQVKTDKKRVKKPQGGFPSKEASDKPKLDSNVPEQATLYPASDPSKVKVIGEKKRKEQERPKVQEEAVQDKETAPKVEKSQSVTEPAKEAAKEAPVEKKAEKPVAASAPPKVKAPQPQSMSDLWATPAPAKPKA